MLFSEPKIPQTSRIVENTASYAVSVLFSEPKIPQTTGYTLTLGPFTSFSALQRAENSSKLRYCNCWRRGTTFQCSSASRKFLKHHPPYVPAAISTKFQCSSASRKFLKVGVQSHERQIETLRFSALQRAENSSNYEFSTFDDGDERVSVLFSEPKIPQI